MRTTGTRRAQRKRAKLLQKHTERVGRGQPISKRVSPSVQRALRVVKSAKEMKAVKRVLSLREQPAQAILGEGFRGRQLVSSMVFETSRGEKLRVRLLKSNDSTALWKMYYEGMSAKNRDQFGSFPIFTGTDTPQKMAARLQEMSINSAPHGKRKRDINLGKAAGAFNPKYPVNKAEVDKGGKPKLFNPSANYVMEDASGNIVGFFQLKYLKQTPIFGAALRDSYHGQGLGALGTRFRVEVARRLGLQTLRATTDATKVSKILLEREGFKAIGETKVHVGLPDERTEILMELKL